MLVSKTSKIERENEPVSELVNTLAEIILRSSDWVTWVHGLDISIWVYDRFPALPGYNTHGEIGA
jgi:hypothetical protein